MDVHLLKRRQREQERQKRERLVQSKAESFPSQVDSPSVPPHFGSLIKRNDANNDELSRMSKHILGPVDMFQVAMSSMNHQQLLGTFESTPGTPLHPVTGNPFDRQFAQGTNAAALTAAAALSSASSLATTAFTSASSSSSAGSSAQSRSELNRHSVAEPPNSTREEKAGKVRGSHGRSDHTSSSVKQSKQPGDSSAFSTSKSIHKKSSKVRDEGSNDLGSRPTNVLVVKKSKEKSRVRPYKTSARSPTGNQPGPVVTKKPSGGAPSQGAGDLFKVDPNRSSSSLAPTPSAPDGGPTRPPTPPVTKKQPKLKKRHSHHFSSAAPTSSADPQPTLPPPAIRKSNSVHSSQSHPSSSSTPHASSHPSHSHSHPSSSSTSHTSSTAHHKLRKQSSSTTHSSHSSAPPPPPHTTQSPSPALALKKHSSNSSSGSLQSSISHHHSSSSYDKEREKARGSDTSVSRHSQALTSKSGSSFAQETSLGSFHSAAPIASSSVATTTVAGGGSSVSAVGSKSVKKKKKKARKEREKEKEEEKEREREREWERPREKERTSTQKPERPVVKPEPLDSVAEPLLAKSTPHYPSSSLGSNLFNPAHQSQQQAALPGNQPLLTYRDQATGGRAGSKVKLEKLRPTNLNIDALDDVDEISVDTGDVQHLLKELICNVSVPPLITPLLTPKKETFPFTFPQSTAPLKHESLFSSHETPPTGPAHPLSDSDSESSGSSSESSSDSSDSDNDDNEQGLGKSMGRVGVAVSTSTYVSMEEGEDSTTPGWEKILPSVGGSITPLTKTPPYPHTRQLLAPVHIPTTFHMPNTVISPLAPETPTTAAAALPLNLSPPHSAASSSSISSFGSFGSFTGVSGFVLGTNVQPQVAPSSVPGDSILSSSFSGSLTAGQPIYSQAAAAAGEMHTRTVIPDIASLAHPLPAAEEHAPHHEEEAASSSSESEDDLGSESDDESSDAEDNSSDEEEDANETGPRPAQGLTAKQSAGNSSVSSATIFTGDDPIFNFPEENSGGFFNGADFFYQLQGGSGRDRKGGEGGESISRDLSTEAHWLAQLTGETAVAAGANLPDQLGKAGEHRSEFPLMAAFSSSQQQQQQHLASHAPSAANSTSSEILSGTQAPPSTTITTAITSIADSNNPVDQSLGSNTDRPIPIAATHSILSKQHSLNDSCSSGKKRKLERQASLTQDPSSSSLSSNLQPPARKALRVGSGHRPVQRRDSSLSSFSVSSDSSSESSDSSDEESETEDFPTFPVSPQHHSPKNPTLPSLPLLLPTSTPSVPASSTSPPYLPPSASPTHQHHLHAGVQEAPPVLQGMLQPQRQLEAGELDEDEVEEGEEVEREEKKGEIWREVESLWVKIPLQKVDLHREQKPKAKVEPYVNVTLPSKPPRRRSTIDSSSHEDLPRLPDRHANDTRNMYSRPREREDDHHAPYSRGEFHRDEGRRQHRSVWDSERDRNDSWSGRHGMRANRSRDRERDHHRGGRDWSEYPYEDSRSRGRGHPSNRHMNMTAEDFLREARKRKHDADKTRTPGIEKAKAYLESVTYFMRHGDAIERDAQTWDGAQTKNPFRLYMDTISLMKYCQSWANDCKQLVALCMKCMSVLYWKLFLLKQTTASHIQRDLQEFFLPSKTQKSPFLSSLSPIPSPASVGSTTSTGSGGGGASTTAPSQDPSPSSHVTVPKLIFNKAADHLTITSYLHQSLELWQQSNLIVEQYGEFFSSLDRRSGRITQYSPISTVADWLETGAARLVRYRS